MKKIIFIMIMIMSILSFYSEASASGILLTSDNNQNWKLIIPKDHYCYISHSNNIQKMILDISFTENIDSNVSLWIVPIPGIKKDVNLDSVKSFPSFSIRTIYEEHDTNITQWIVFLLASQLYTAPLTAMDPSPMRGLYSTRPIVCDDKYKINTNIINVNELNDFLSNNKIKISPYLLSSVSNYSNDNYVLLVSQINVPETMRNSNVSKNKNNYDFNHLNLNVKFKTDKIFYPLKILSIYGENPIDICLNVIKIIEADFNNIINQKNGKKCEIYYNSLLNSQVDSNFRDLLTEQYYKNIYFSSVLIKAKSQDFINDLYVGDDKPANIQKKIFVLDNIYMIFLAVFIIASCLSSFIASRIYYMGSAPTFYKTLQLGLLNFTTLIGVLLFSARIIKDKNNKSATPYVIMFSIIFIT